MLSYALVLFVGFVAGTVSGVVGTGATVILLPVLVMVFGPREAVPIMAVVALMSNFAKITAWRRHIDWRASAAYALGGIPAAALGARTLLALPVNTVETALGIFFLAREWLPALDFDWFWPAMLIVLGVVLLVGALGRNSGGSGPGTGS